MNQLHPLRIANHILHQALVRVRDARRDMSIPSALHHIDQALGLLHAAEELIDIATYEQKHLRDQPQR